MWVTLIGHIFKFIHVASFICLNAEQIPFGLNQGRFLIRLPLKCFLEDVYRWAKLIGPIFKFIHVASFLCLNAEHFAFSFNQGRFLIRLPPK